MTAGGSAIVASMLAFAAPVPDPPPPGDDAANTEAAAEEPATAAPGPAEPVPDLPTVDADAAKADAAWALGAAAYQRGDLEEAIAQFRETYRYSGSPGPLFSLGQAHRHQFEATQDDLHRRLAIQSYRAYIELAPEGARRPEATEHIARLQTTAERELEGIDRPDIFTGVSVTADAAGARVSIDGAPPLEVPVAPTLEVGPHRVVVEAPGYRPWTRRVHVSQNSTVSVVAHLEPLPATLRVDGPAGADVYVDGSRVARLPLPQGITVPPGPHQIGVARKGRTLYVREVDLGRGESRELQAELEPSGQRKVAIAAIALGSGGLVAAGVLTGLSLRAQSRARSIEDEREDAFVDLDRELDGRALQDERDRLRAAAIGTAIGGGIAVVTGVALYLSDKPPVASQLHPPGERPSRVRAGPDIAAGRVGLRIGGRF